jgi:hypothetical protein
MKRTAVALGAAFLLLTACPGTSHVSLGPSFQPQGTHVTAVPAGPTRLVTGSAAKEMRKLCEGKPPPQPKTTPVRHVPPVVTETEQWVEQVRGLSYKHPVAVAAVTHHELVQGIDQQFATSFPTKQVARQSLVWQTVGALPKGTDIKEAVHKFLSTQVIGYYDSDSKKLVFIGTDNPTPSERFTLAHELTHALDDQYFHLSRLDTLGLRCEDELDQAARGVVEGNAVFFSSGVVLRYFSQSDQRQVQSQAGSSTPTGIPPFILNQETWPYSAGPRFIAALYRRGGTASVDQAMRHWPVSTEQVMHPSRYPNDVPTPLDIPEIAPTLGAGWHDIDVEEVGEEELAAMLGTRLDPSEWRPAVDGWDGGLIRAWQNGPHVAVVLRTAWDSARDAGEFRDAVYDWISTDQVSTVASNDRLVDAAFTTDPQALHAVRKALSVD